MTKSGVGFMREGGEQKIYKILLAKRRMGQNLKMWEEKIVEMLLTGMCREECVALLDHSYHTVLSSRSETSLNILLMEGLVKRRWLNRPPQLQVNCC